MKILSPVVLPSPRWCWLLGPLLLTAHLAVAVVRDVSTAAQFSALPSSLQAGDIVIVHAGDYSGVNKKITANGTDANPVQIYASPLGSARFTGTTKIELAGTNMVFAGFRFEDGTVSSYALLYSRYSRYIRVSNCAFRRFVGDTWVLFQGFDNTMEYCSFEEKSDPGAWVIIKPQELDNPANQRRHRFRFNYMGERVAGDSNGWEGVRIGDSSLQGYEMDCILEYNRFYRTIWTTNGLTAGDMEVISSKSAGNVYRYNTLHENRGQITLRHGDRCVVEGNFIFGDGAAWSTGVRVMGEHHIIRNNYIENTRGYDLRGGITLMPGDANWTETSSGYEACSYAQVYNNTLVNCYRPLVLGFKNRGQSVKPHDVELRDNLILSQTGDPSVVEMDLWDTNTTVFSGNLAFHPDGNYAPLLPGFSYDADLRMAYDAQLGYYVPGSGSAAIGTAGQIDGLGLDVRGALRPATARDVGALEVGAVPASHNRPLTRADVGPSYDGGPTNTFWPPGTAPGQAAAAPVASSAPGNYSAPIAVALATPTFGAFIRYTLDGTQPTATHGDTYINPIPLSANTTLRAVALHSALAVSPELSGTYTFNGATIPPFIVTDPGSQVIAVGSVATFTVAAEGSAPLSYRWRFNVTNNLAGATNASLVITNAQPTNAGNYTVVVTNAYGAVTSAVAVLNVVTPVAPGITNQPASQTVAAGATVTFGVGCSGTEPLIYQWYFNTNIPLADANNATLTLYGVRAADAGGYFVVVTNLAGSVTSSVAHLTVNAPPVSTNNVIVDDTWLDGTRTNTLLPIQSAWYASSASSLVAASGSMTGIASSSSVTWWTYFTTNPASPVQLGTGDTLKVTLRFIPSGVNTSDTSHNLRLGLFDGSGSTRRTSDGGTPTGTNVMGYMLNMNFAQTIGVSTPLQLMERTDLSSSSLISSSGAYTLLASSSGAKGDPAFSNGVPCALEFSVTRTSNSVAITTTFSDANGWSNSLTTADNTLTNITDSFDTFVIRPASAAQTATNFVFTEFKVEIIAASAPPVTRPALHIALNGRTVVLSWTTNNTDGFQLESALVVPANTWTFAGLPATIGNQYAVTNEVTNATARYYRLRKP